MDHLWSTNHTAMMVLRLYNSTYRSYHYSDDPEAGAMSKLLNSLSILGQLHLTRLQLQKIATDCEFRPFTQPNRWDSRAVPTFTVCSGDMGHFISNSSGDDDWEVLEVCNRVGDESCVSPASLWSKTVRFRVV